MEKNKKWIAAMGLLLCTVWGHSQVAPDRYLVFFADKDNTPYSIDKPAAFLSDRALERRESQNIPIDEKDLPVDPAYIQLVIELGEVKVIEQIKWFNAILIETTDPEVLMAVTDLGGVERLEVSTTLGGDDDWEINEQKLTARAKLMEEYGPSINQIDILNGLGLHQDGFKGSGKWIAVLDGGFQYADSAAVLQPLINSGRLVARRNFVEQTDSVFSRSNHGTYVLSIMAGLQADSLIGTAPEASYLLGITEDVAQERRVEEALWAAGAAYADSIGADIINTSLGYTDFDTEEETYSYADMDGNTTLITRASDIAASRGMLIVTSAGNEGDDDWFYIAAPADGDSVLAIGSVNSNEQVSSFSSRGPSADGRVKPNVMAQGRGATITDLNEGITSGNGTSFSSPVMAGMAACLWQAYPFATAWQVHKAIEQSAHLCDNPNDSLGYGIPDFEMARDILALLASVQNPQPGKVFSVYPNPTDGLRFFLNFAEAGLNAQLELFDITGRLIYRDAINTRLTFTDRKLNAHLQRSGAGVYMLRIRDQRGDAQTARLVVM